MAHLTCWEFTELPVEIIDVVEREIKKFDDEVEDSNLTNNVVDKSIRDSHNSWIPESHWITGWLWYYVEKINRKNFVYDITDFDAGTLQYTHYGPDQYYTWHSDDDVSRLHKPDALISTFTDKSQDDIIINSEYVRKLSFSLQLSDPDQYTGGELEFLDNSGKTMFAPKQRGTMVVFDSRLKHRVRRVKSGLRKSIVGWVVGPRWK